MVQYFFYAISVNFLSWAIGELLNQKIKEKQWYCNFSKLNFIKSEKLRKLVGLRLFQSALTNTILKRFNRKLQLNQRKTLTDLKKLRVEMTNAEISHFMAFLITLISSIIVFYFNMIFGLLIFSLNIPMNLYPSLLQQQNNERIDEILKIKASGAITKY